MRRGVRGAVVLLALALTACTEEAEPFYPPDEETVAFPAEYDPDLPPAAAALFWVPAEAMGMQLTDYDALRLALGYGDLSSSTPQPQRDAFWAAVPTTAAFSTGLLRPASGQLAKYGFGQDDVSWEAHYSGAGVDGWVLALDDDVDMAKVEEAVGANIGALAGAVVDAERRIVTSDRAPEVANSWAADPIVTPVVFEPGDAEDAAAEADDTDTTEATDGATSASTDGSAPTPGPVATYVEAGCIDFGDVFDTDAAALAPSPAAVREALAPLEAFAVEIGQQLATVHLGPTRSDAFDRARLADVMPETQPSFAAAFTNPAADPAGGHIGYHLGNPRAAARLTIERHLPFAVCGS